MQFIIKDAANITLNPLVGGGSPIVIDYLNTFSMKTESDKLTAKAKGVDAMVIYGSKTCTFELGSDLLSKDQLAMLLGGELEGTKITVKEDVSIPYYSLSGLFTIKYTDGSEEVQTLTAGKVCAEPNGELATSASEISSHTLTMNILATDGVLFEIDKKAAAF